LNTSQFKLVLQQRLYIPGRVLEIVTAPLGTCRDKQSTVATIRCPKRSWGDRRRFARGCRCRWKDPAGEGPRLLRQNGTPTRRYISSSCLSSTSRCLCCPGRLLRKLQMNGYVPGDLH